MAAIFGFRSRLATARTRFCVASVIAVIISRPISRHTILGKFIVSVKGTCLLLDTKKSSLVSFLMS